MYKFVYEVRPGDIIIEGNNRTTVIEVDTAICRLHTHINGKDCYDNATQVRLQD